MELLLGLYFILTIVFFIISLVMSNGKISVFWITPNSLYDSENVNYVTCILIFLFLLIINPITYFLGFLYWITHVGRKK